MRLYPHGGYSNPGYGAFGIGVTVQVTVALCLLALAGGNHDGPKRAGNGPHRISYTSVEFCNAMGGLHLLGGGVTALVVIVGYLVLPFALCPLPLITILNWCLMFATAGCCGHVLAQVQNLEKMYQSNYGLYFIWEVSSSVSLWIASALSMLYAGYSVFTEKPPELKKEDSGERGEDADEKVELKQEEPRTADVADQP